MTNRDATYSDGALKPGTFGVPTGAERHCPSCNIWWKRTLDTVCPRCGTQLELGMLIWPAGKGP